MSRKKKMTLLIFGIILIIIAIAGGVWWFMMMGRPNPSLPEERLVVGSSAFTVEIASTTLQKMTGLSFRTALAPDHGMLFTFGAAAVQNFWMKDMNFAIDMIWIGGGKVLGFAQDAVPQAGAQLWQLTIYSSPDGTDQVLEVPAGTVAKDTIHIGDSVVISQ